MSSKGEHEILPPTDMATDTCSVEERITDTIFGNLRASIANEVKKALRESIIFCQESQQETKCVPFLTTPRSVRLFVLSFCLVTSGMGRLHMKVAP